MSEIPWNRYVKNPLITLWYRKKNRRAINSVTNYVSKLVKNEYIYLKYVNISIHVIF